MENTLEEVEENLDTSSILFTPDPQDRNSKRARQEGSYSAKATSDSKFNLMYKKETKLNLVIEKKDTIETEKEIAFRDDKPTPHTEETPLPSSSST